MGDYGDVFMRKQDPAVQARTKAQNRATVLQLKLIGQSHPTGLTANLLKLFEPRLPLEYKPPPEKRKLPSYTGMAQFVQHFAEPGDPEYAPPVKEVETRVQKMARIHKLRMQKGAENAAAELEKYDPTKDPNVTGDPYKTLFVARLNYETTEQKMKREFEVYGPIKRADGRKIDNRRVLVDVERGRTVPNWRPRRLGGGLGSTRVGGEEVNQKYSGREPQTLSAGPPRSEEPKVREERHDDRERDRRERDRDRERSRERSGERSREHSRVRERERDRERDRDRDREHARGGHHRDHDRDRERGDRHRDRERGGGGGRDRDHHRDRERERDRGRDRDRDREKEVLE